MVCGFFVDYAGLLKKSGETEARVEPGRNVGHDEHMPDQTSAAHPQQKKSLGFAKSLSLPIRHSVATVLKVMVCCVAMAVCYRVAGSFLSGGSTDAERCCWLTHDPWRNGAVG